VQHGTVKHGNGGDAVLVRCSLVDGGISPSLSVLVSAAVSGV